jgi:hypothetical protein
LVELGASMKTVKLLILALALVGCSATIPARGPIYIDPRIPETIKASIRRAHAEWCDATRGRECPTLKTGRGRYQYRWGERDHDNAGTKRGLFGVDVFVDFAGISQGSWVAAIKHEIGHELGLHHVSYGLMRGADTGGPWAREGVPDGCIDQRTLADYCAARGCPLGVKPECIEP